MTGFWNLLRTGRERLTGFLTLASQLSRSWIAIGFVIGCTVGFVPVAIFGVISINVPPVEPTAVVEPIAVAVKDQPSVEPAVATPIIDNDLTATAATADASNEMGAEADPNAVIDQTPIPVISPASLLEAVNGRFAILLMGYGGTGHDGAFLTDSLIVVVVDAPKKSVTLVSVPRDSWVPMMFDGKTASTYNKVNTAYALGKDPSIFRGRLPRYNGDHGAGEFAADTVSRILGIPIQYYMGIDFAGFRDMIDAVGGVEVDVVEAFASLYPANDNPSIDPSWITVRFTKGPQKMNGARAIQYARARQTIDNSNEGGDFARSRRQRVIMEAFKNRLMQPDAILRIPQLFTIAAKHIDTNYDVPVLTQIGQLLSDWKSVEIYQAALTGANYLENATGPEGAYVLVPTAPNHSWSQIRALGRHLWENPAQGIAMAESEIIVINRTGQVGVGGQVTALLTKLGYRTKLPDSGTTSAETRLLSRPGGFSASLATRLASDLHLRSLPIVENMELAKGEIRLELGSEELRIVRISDPADANAPSSSTGLVRYSGWVNDTEPEDTPRPVARTGTPAQPTRRDSVLTPGAHTPTGGTTPLASRIAAGPTVTPGASANATPLQPARTTPTTAPGGGLRVASPTEPPKPTPLTPSKP